MSTQGAALLRNVVLRGTKGRLLDSCAGEKARPERRGDSYADEEAGSQRNSYRAPSQTPKSIFLSRVNHRSFHSTQTHHTMAPPTSTAESAASAVEADVKSSIANNWSTPGPAAYDFRSDTITTPTASMLAAITSTTLLDDVMQEDTTTTSLETHISQLAGKEAGLFVLSGTMGNQLALRSLLTQPPHSVLCDSRAHILQHEAGGVSSLSGAMVMGVQPKNGAYLTLEDVKRHVVLDDDVHSCPTRVISLENTLGGVIMPLSEVQKISAFARENGVKMHLDGARLWEAVTATGVGLDDWCGYFDTVSLCFSKGLGAPVGSMLVGTEKLVKHARWVRKSIGGGMRMTGVLTAPARVAVDETFGPGRRGEGGKLRRVHEVAAGLGRKWVELGGRLEKEIQTNMLWLDLEAAGWSDGAFNRLGEEHGLKLWSGRIVVHYQIADEAVESLKKVMEIVLSSKPGSNEVKKVGERTYK